MDAPVARILVVEDEPVIRNLLKEVLSRDGREIVFAECAADGLARAKEAGGIDLALLDKNLRDGSGLDVARALKEMSPASEVILMTGYASLDSAVEALKIGAFDYITKPFDDINKLALQVQNALDKARLERERVRLTRELGESEQRYALAAQGSNDGLWDWNLETGEVYFSPRWKGLLGYDTDGDSIGTSPETWLGRIHEDDAQRVRSGLRAHLEGGVSHFQDEHRVRHEDGTFRWVLARGLAFRDAEGKPVRLAGSLTDVTERRLAEQQMQYDALHDGVTLLPNRVLFLDRLGQALARTRRRSAYRFAVVLLDLDRFKIVNESLGPSIGDELLVATARRLETCLRAGDTAARLGGDEFAILLDDITDTSDAVRVAERVQTELAAPHTLSGRDVFTTSSIGISLSHPGYHRPEELLRDADIAMYRAKALGKARHVVFDQGMQGRAVRLLDLDSALRRAIERREFVLHYQPIVSLEHGAIVGFEALVRWMHPERGLVAPGDFIPVAEETGLIIPISQLVLSEACTQLRQFQEYAGNGHRPYMSVNVSAKHLIAPGLVDDVEAVVSDIGIPPSSLRIEITESVVMENARVAARTLEALKALDVQIYMDDFGTGYSSLSTLHRLPIDALKIDRSFVSRLGVDGENPVIVHTILTLARVLGLEVIAEGIETAEQLAQLRTLECDLGQGFYFAHPMPASAVEALLAESPRWLLGC
jgi:diguanylate cyclase (GGDEF)-like protein/PAS domain S-box-containing protein